MPMASLSIQDPPELKHATFIRYNRFIRPMYDIVCSTQLDTMAVIREPISWMRSWYRYRQRPFLNGKPASTQGISLIILSGDIYNQLRPPMRILAVKRVLLCQDPAHRQSPTYSDMRTKRDCGHFWNSGSRPESRCYNTTFRFASPRLASNRVKLIGRCCTRSRKETPNRL